jgi:hypothetical protein
MNNAAQCHIECCRENIKVLAPDEAYSHMKKIAKTINRLVAKEKNPRRHEMQVDWTQVRKTIEDNYKSYRYKKNQEEKRERDIKRREARNQVDKKRKHTVIEKCITDLFSNGICYKNLDDESLSQEGRLWVQSNIADDIMYNICSFLDYETSKNIRLVSRGMHTIIHSLPQIWDIINIVLHDTHHGIDSTWARRMVLFSKYDPSRDYGDREYLHNLETVYMKQIVTVGLTKKSPVFMRTDANMSLVSDLLPLHQEMLQNYHINNASTEVQLRVHAKHYLSISRRVFSLYLKHGNLINRIGIVDCEISCCATSFPYCFMMRCANLHTYKGPVTWENNTQLINYTGGKNIVFPIKKIIMLYNTLWDFEKLAKTCPQLEQLEIYYTGIKSSHTTAGKPPKQLEITPACIMSALKDVTTQFNGNITLYSRHIKLEEFDNCGFKSHPTSNKDVLGHNAYFRRNSRYYLCEVFDDDSDEEYSSDDTEDRALDPSNAEENDFQVFLHETEAFNDFWDARDPDDDDTLLGAILKDNEEIKKRPQNLEFDSIVSTLNNEHHSSNEPPAKRTRIE